MPDISCAEIASVPKPGELGSYENPISICYPIESWDIIYVGCIIGETDDDVVDIYFCNKTMRYYMWCVEVPNFGADS